jgi:hypothetical protein
MTINMYQNNDIVDKLKKTIALYENKGTQIKYITKFYKLLEGKKLLDIK